MFCLSFSNKYIFVGSASNCSFVDSSYLLNSGGGISSKLYFFSCKLISSTAIRRATNFSVKGLVANTTPVLSQVQASFPTNFSILLTEAPVHPIATPTDLIGIPAMLIGCSPNPMGTPIKAIGCPAIPIGTPLDLKECRIISIGCSTNTIGIPIDPKECSPSRITIPIMPKESPVRLIEIPADTKGCPTSSIGTPAGTVGYSITNQCRSVKHMNRYVSYANH